MDGRKHLPRVPGGRWIKIALLSKCARGRMKIRRNTRVMRRGERRNLVSKSKLYGEKRRNSERQLKPARGRTKGRTSKKKPLPKCAAVYNYIYGRPNGIF